MDLFLSTYENRIDGKGRISVPASFRAVLERNRSPLFIYKSLTHSCLEGCGPERIGQIVDAIDKMDSLSEDAEILTNCGNALKDYGEFTQAIECYAKALDIGPNLADVKIKIDNAVREKASVENAIKKLVDRKEIFPEDAQKYKKKW